MGKIITVKEWFFDKTNEAAHSYFMSLIGEYKDGMLDHTKLRVNSVLGETEKAIKAELEAETYAGHYKPYITWIPKSVIE